MFAARKQVWAHGFPTPRLLRGSSQDPLSSPRRQKPGRHEPRGRHLALDHRHLRALGGCHVHQRGLRPRLRGARSRGTQPRRLWPLRGDTVRRRHHLHGRQPPRDRCRPRGPPLRASGWGSTTSSRSSTTSSACAGRRCASAARASTACARRGSRSHAGTYHAS